MDDVRTITKVDRSKPVIACFDLGTVTGLAYGTVGSRPRLLTFDLSVVEGRPRRLLLLDGMVEKFLANHRVDKVFYEKPLNIRTMMKIGATDDVVQMLRGLAAVIEQASARHSLPVDSWETVRARLSVLGRGRWPAGKAKAGVMAGVKILGYSPANHNEGDALIGHLFMSAVLCPPVAYRSTPLFAAAAR
jgi:hypothetical protein